MGILYSLSRSWADIEAPEHVAPTVATTGVLVLPAMHGVPWVAAPSSATLLEQPLIIKKKKNWEEGAVS